MKHDFKKVSLFLVFTIAVLAAVFLLKPFEVKNPVSFSKDTESFKPTTNSQLYQKYLNFFEEVYGMMDENYYHPVSRDAYNRFIEKFDAKIYPNVQAQKVINKYVRWRSAAYLVDYLKTSDDPFSAFFPPQAVEKFTNEVLGKKIDLGIEGEKVSGGFLVSRVEPRSNAYQKGLTPGDMIQRIDAKEVVPLTLEEIQEYLSPLEGKEVQLTYLDSKTGESKTMQFLSEEYFRQTVFMVPLAVPDIYCLTVNKFNRKTSEDMLRFLKYILEKNPKGLILDLRGNPGGPPLAAQEISSFFLTPKEEFAYFQKKGKPKAMLTVPEIPEELRYSGPMVILVNEKSGSASELFSGTMQHMRRAVLMGQTTAGKVLLKSMFHFDDQSMLLLVTSRGYLPDGTPFSFDGIVPDQFAEGDQKVLINLAAGYLLKTQRVD